MVEISKELTLPGYPFQKRGLFNYEKIRKKEVYYEKSQNSSQVQIPNTNSACTTHKRWTWKMPPRGQRHLKILPKKLVRYNYFNIL